MRSLRALASAVGGATAIFVALVVHAQPASSPEQARVALTWRAPIGCPDDATVREGVLALLAGSQVPVNARADVTHASDGWRVVVTMNGGERRIEATTCRAIAEATELIVAMAVDPERVAHNRALSVAGAGVVDAGGALAVPVADASFAVDVVVDAGPVDASPAVIEAQPPPPPPATVSTIAVTPEVTRPASWPSTRFAVAALGVMDVGTLPAPAVGPGLAFAWTPRPFRFEVAGAYFFPDSTPPTPTTGAVARFTMLTGSLRGCAVASLPPSARLDVGACALLEVARVHGEGVGILHPGVGSSGWIAPGAGLVAGFRLLRPLALVARADMLIPAIRPGFRVDETTIHRPSAVTARFSIGAELRF